MKALSLPTFTATVLISALLSACSSSSDTPLASADTPEGPIAEAPEDALPDASTDSPLAPIAPESPVDDDTADTDEPTPGDEIGDEIDEATPPTTGEQPGDATLPPTTLPPTTELPDSDDTLPDDQTTMLMPRVVEGGDLDRLLRAVTRQVSLTVLDLNARLADGTVLTEQQNVCLGTYDPALGEQLLAVDCEQALATGSVPVRVETAGFYDTSACHADVFIGNTDACVLEYARVTIPTQWVIPELPADSPPGTPQRPTPIAGIEIYYAIDNTELRIENTTGALTGVFRCDLDLADNEGATIIPGQSCAEIIKSAADRLDTVLPE